MDRKLYNCQRTKDFRRKLRSEMTQPEKLLWSKLRASQLDGFKFRRQQGIGDYIADFYCPRVKLVIEIDGESHYVDQGAEKDRVRDKFMTENAITIIRFTNNEINENLEGVLESICAKLQELAE